MSDEPIRTIQPANASLASQIQALDLLSARLSHLNQVTRWPAKVPLNSKATMDGVLLNTNDAKISIGEGYFVGMTALEAVESVKRRKEGTTLSPELYSTSSHLEQPCCWSMLGLARVGAEFLTLYSTYIRRRNLMVGRKEP